jgi:16S rRNA (uracil1498-N3)-methyltransferase
MRVTRIHVDAVLAIGIAVVLPEAPATHLLRVLRLQVGDVCVLFNGDGCDYSARIVAIDKSAVRVEVGSMQPLDNESSLRIALLQALARGDKMDWILQKATELGVNAIIPVMTERSEVKLDAERSGKRASHWRNVIVSACEQSGRATVPSIAMASSLEQALKVLPEESQRLVLAPTAARGLADIAVSRNRLQVIAVGPEGGWSARDIMLLAGTGFAEVRLGPRILRTETAGVAAIATLQSRFGDLG